MPACAGMTIKSGTHVGAANFTPVIPA